MLKPIMDVTSNDLICNGGINPYHQPVSTKIIQVPAGTQVTAEWHHTLNGADPNDTADPIDASHKGPVLAYLCVISHLYCHNISFKQYVVPKFKTRLRAMLLG